MKICTRRCHGIAQCDIITRQNMPPINCGKMNRKKADHGSYLIDVMKCNNGGMKLTLTNLTISA